MNMIVQEPVQATIWFTLNHYAYNDAIFLAERLNSEVGSDETLYLLATCYYRAGKQEAAYSILSKRSCKSSRCRLLLARCCVDLKKYSEAEEALLCSFAQFEAKHSAKCLITTDELVAEYSESASFVAQLLALICAKTERLAKAVDYYKKSLKLNPFLWSSFENLVHLGVKVDPTKTFDVSNINFNLCHGCNPLINLWNQRLPETTGVSSQAPLVTASTKDFNQANPGKYEINSPFAVIKPGQESSCIDVVTPETNSWTAMSVVPQKLGNAFRKNCLGTVTENSPMSPFRSDTPTGMMRLSFGVFPLNDVQQQQGLPACTPTEVSDTKGLPIANVSKIARAPVKRQTRRTQQQQPGQFAGRNNNAPKAHIFSQSGNINAEVNYPSMQPSAPLTNQPGGLPPPPSLSLRRSSRLFNSSSSVKENTKNSARNQENNKTTITSKTPTKKTRKQTTTSASMNSSTTSLQQKESELNEINKSDLKQGTTPSAEDLVQTGLKMQRASAEGLMNLLIELGKALVNMGQFHSHKAIEVLRSLPMKHLNSGWVLSAMGRAFFELAKYEDSAKYFEEAHTVDPHRLQGMEYYSTALWHLQSEVKLSMLAQELVEYDKNAPETWCVAGNCFSLQKEHETAIKFLQRAIQVEADFAYAYTLLGHELVSTEEMDTAMACFRNAIRIDPRHYNAWYGIGMICFKQEKYSLAEIHYRKALEISPYSPVLTCHLGVVQHSLKKTELALQTLDKAIEMDPNNALCKFQRASFYLAMDKHSQALSELEQLKQLVPKESLVYFLIGKVHKRLGNTHLALMNFSWAMDLDPKGANNQIKEVIDRQYANDDDEVVVCLDSNNEEPSASAATAGSSSGSNSSSVGAHMRRRGASGAGHLHFESMDADNEERDDNSIDNEGNLEVSI